MLEKLRNKFSVYKRAKKNKKPANFYFQKFPKAKGAKAGITVSAPKTANLNEKV